MFCAIHNVLIFKVGGQVKLNVTSTVTHGSHPCENEMIIGTHGRGCYILDIKPVQKRKEITRKSGYFFKLAPIENFELIKKSKVVLFNYFLGVLYFPGTAQFFLLTGELKR